MKLIDQLRIHKEKAIWGLFVVLGGLIFLLEAPWKSAEAPPVTTPESVDTFIPRGHLLVPVELQNAEQLQGLIGATTVVDLHAVTPGQRARPVGRRLRLLRAPLNPLVFAVLIRDTEADRVLSFPGPFKASIRSPLEEAHEVIVQNASLSWDEGGQP